MAGRDSHASWFSYPVTRPYPLRWFTPVAIVGGILFTVLVSFGNIVAYGYQLTSTYTSDPDNIAQGLWFKHWPSFLTNGINATCEPANLPVNSEFFTDKDALTYTLSSIDNIKNGQAVTSTSLPYLNNAMGQCDVTNITMEFDCAKTGNPTQITQAACRIDVRAFSACTFDGPSGQTTFNLISLYNPYQPYYSPGSSGFINTDNITSASLWWAQQLLTAYWLDTNIAVYSTIGNTSTTYNSAFGIEQGFANFYRNSEQNDIAELDFFDVQFQFNGLIDGTYFYGTNSAKALIEDSSVAGTGGPPIWLQADRLAKSMYSAVLTDLGQTNVPKSSNIVLSPDTLQTYSQNFSALHNMGNIIGVPIGIRTEIADGTYDSLKDTIELGPLQVTPSVITTNYLCSVPRWKSTGSIFISVLLADLVFLQAAWVIYCMVVQRFFVRSATANYCEGCLNGADDLHPLRDFRKSTASSAPSLPALGFATQSSSTAYVPLQIQRNDSQESLVGRTARHGNVSDGQ